MPIAILDPFSGIAGDMTLGAMLDVGLDPEWLTALPERLGLGGVTVRIQNVHRGGIACRKVDFDIPPQPHGRHIGDIRRLVSAAGLPEAVAARADAVFTAIAAAEGEIHGIPAEQVHLHEVGAVDAILDVVGVVWGLERLGVTAVYCGTLSLGDGFVTAAHGVLPVPAPATLKLLAGHPVRPGPAGAGELVTPTGAAIVKVVSQGPPPETYVPVRAGFGAGTRDPQGRANALRLILAEPVSSDAGVETLVALAADVDDMTGEHLAELADSLRQAGALDVVLLATQMKKGRPGTRVELLARPAAADALEARLLQDGTTLGVRRWSVVRRALEREMQEVLVLGEPIRMKVARLPDGTERAKPEFDDARRAAVRTGRSVTEVTALAIAALASRNGARCDG